VTTTCRRASAFQTARAPTKRPASAATSTRAYDVSAPSTQMRNLLWRRQVSPRSTMPDATAAAARPAMVPSTQVGSTLFVPLDSGRMGTSPAPRAAARVVPSPPSTTRHPAPIVRISAAARTVSSAVPRTGMGRISATGGGSTRLASPCIARSANRYSSGIRSTRSIPSAARPTITRRMTLTLDWLSSVAPCAIRRRISLPAAGLAMIPTIARPPLRRGLRGRTRRPPPRRGVTAELRTQSWPASPRR